MFKYVFIPADSSLPLAERRLSKEGGLDNDFLLKEEEIIKFLVNPNFKITNFDQLVNNIKDKDIWRILNKNTPNILINDFSQSLKSTISKDRYNIFSKQDKQLFLDSPILFLLLAEAYYWLENQYECYDKLIELRNNLNCEDILLNELILKMENLLRYLEKEDDKLNNNKTIEDLNGEENECCGIYEFSSPFKLTNNIVLNCNMEDIINRWNDYKLPFSDSQQIALEQFSRYACISTNELEGVFETDDKTWSRLIKKGFYNNSIDGITENSKIRKKDKIINILNSTNKAMNLISELIDNKIEFNEDFIKNIHRILLYENNIEEFEDLDEDGYPYKKYILITAGKFRKIAAYTRHKIDDNKFKYIQFCHHSEINNEMSEYCKEVRRILNDNNIHPYVKASWIQWAFLRIHPFEDGNGRVSRIISSIPFYKDFLPPIVINIKKKGDYFNALQYADEFSDITKLSYFLIEGMIDTMNYLKEINGF